jgi:hypothetical protein
MRARLSGKSLSEYVAGELSRIDDAVELPIAPIEEDSRWRIM